MKLSFSTRGWADMTWPDMLSEAEETGFSGVEIYSVFQNPELTDKGGPFHKYAVAATVRSLREKCLAIPCFDSSLDITGAEEERETLKQMISLASDMHTPYVSCKANHGGVEEIARAIEPLIPLAAEKNVTILLKTAGVFGDTGKLRELLDRFACDELGVLWDVHHPYRDCGETTAETIKNLGAYVKHVHLRDSRDAGDHELIGEGNFPISDLMRALSSIDYDGFISLEWKPEWMEDLTDREVIFPHFVNYMSRFENTRGKRRSLDPNHDGTGQYIWKKDELINYPFSQVLDRVSEDFPAQYCFKYTTLD